MLIAEWSNESWVLLATLIAGVLAWAYEHVRSDGSRWQKVADAEKANAEEHREMRSALTGTQRTMQRLARICAQHQVHLSNHCDRLENLEKKN